MIPLTHAAAEHVVACDIIANEENPEPEIKHGYSVRKILFYSSY
jgi:hypothetical protein